MFVLIYSIKCIHNIAYKMYLQNEKMPQLWVFVDFSILIKEGSNKYIRLFCKMKLWDKLEKEKVVGKCSAKKMFLETSQNSQEKPLLEPGVSFLIKLHASGLNLYQKRDSNTGVFPWIWWNFLRTLFLRTPLLAASVQKVYFCRFFVTKKVLNESFFNLLV